MRKLFFSLILMFFVCVGSVRVYGFYQDTQTTRITESSTHEVLSQTLITESDKNLVPRGSVLSVNDAEEIVFEYEVFVQNGLDITCTAENLTMGGESVDASLADLFVFEFDRDELRESSIRTDLLTGREDGHYVRITLRVSMDEPTYEQYQTLADKALNFDVVFRAASS